MHCNPLWSTLQSLDIDAPADLMARDVTTDSSVLTWIPPLADIDGYILTYRDEDGNMQVLYAGTDSCSSMHANYVIPALLNSL